VVLADVHQIAVSQLANITSHNFDRLRQDAAQQTQEVT
jgi:hypothetical protein